MTEQSTWREEFKKEFGHHGEIWNGKKGDANELEVKSFIESEKQKSFEAGKEEMAIEEIKAMETARKEGFEAGKEEGRMIQLVGNDENIWNQWLDKHDSDSRTTTLKECIEIGEERKTCGDECYKEHDHNLERIKDQALSDYQEQLKKLL